MKTKNNITIKFKDKSYDVNIENLLIVISKLENRKIFNLSNDEIHNYLKKYQLYDDIFFKNVNRIIQYR